jgi:hypothetical protein
MPTQLYGGSLADFTDSLAGEIEDALRDARLEAGLDVPPDDDDRRILFIAIGRGVVAHLQKKQEAFRIHVEGTLPIDTTPTIEAR